MGRLFVATSRRSLIGGLVQVYGHVWTLDDAVGPCFEQSRCVEGLFYCFVAWLKNEE